MRKIKRIKRWLIVLGIAVARLLFWFVVYLISRRFPELTYKIYTKNIYPLITAPMRWISGVLPFSIVGVLIIVLGGGAILSFIVLLIIKRKYLLRQVLCVVIVACLFAGNYFAYGGINYNASSFKDVCNVGECEADVETLKAVCIYLGRMASACREDFDGRDFDEVVALAPEAMALAVEEFDCLDGDCGVVKGAIFSEILSYQGITGITPIVFSDAVVNKNTPIVSVPHTACHELAHRLGFMREDEANFIGFVACIHSEDKLYRYSGWYNGFAYAMNSLYKADKEAWYEVWQDEQIDYGIYEDRLAESEFWQSYEDAAPSVSEFSDKMNDAYLKANNVEGGVQSYGRVTELLIWYLSQDADNLELGSN